MFLVSSESLHPVLEMYRKLSLGAFASASSTQRHPDNVGLSQYEKFGQNLPDIYKKSVKPKPKPKNKFLIQKILYNLEDYHQTIR